MPKKLVEKPKVQPKPAVELDENMIPIKEK